MITKSKLLNYITILLAIGTIAMAIYTAQVHGNPGFCILLLILTLVFRSMSQYETNKELFGTKAEKQNFKQTMAQWKQSNTKDISDEIKSMATLSKESRKKL